MEMHISQNKELRGESINSYEHVRDKDLTPDEDEDDDEDMDESVNQDNDENEDDDKDDLELSAIEKTNAILNRDSHKSGDSSDIHSTGQPTSNLSNKTSRRKNKRKNFKPRNILYDGNDEEMEEQSNKDDNGAMDDSEHGSDQGPLNLSGHNGNNGGKIQCHWCLSRQVVKPDKQCLHQFYTRS